MATKKTASKSSTTAARKVRTTNSGATKRVAAAPKKAAKKVAPAKAPAKPNRPTFHGRDNVVRFALTTESLPRGSRRCVMAVNFTGEPHRTVVTIPSEIADRLDAAIVGPGRTAIVPLAVWALDELERQNLRLIVKPADRAAFDLVTVKVPRGDTDTPRCTMGVNFTGTDKARTVMVIPAFVAARLDAAVLGPKQTGLLALACWALDELLRQKKRLTVGPG